MFYKTLLHFLSHVSLLRFRHRFFKRGRRFCHFLQWILGKGLASQFLFQTSHTLRGTFYPQHVCTKDTEHKEPIRTWFLALCGCSLTVSTQCNGLLFQTADLLSIPSHSLFLLYSTAQRLLSPCSWKAEVLVLGEWQRTRHWNQENKTKKGQRKLVTDAMSRLWSVRHQGRLPALLLYLLTCLSQTLQKTSCLNQ